MKLHLYILSYIHIHCTLYTVSVQCISKGNFKLCNTLTS